MAEISFIAVDWGTTSFRLWVTTSDGKIAGTFNGPLGMSQLKRNDFANVLEDSIAKLSIGSDVPVIICGMAGAAQGWCEAPYLQAPTRLDTLGAKAIKVPGINRDVWILPGIKQMAPANVMRGEETQIAGLLYHKTGFEGTVCLPGTHTKWVEVVGTQVKQFETCMTGEQFALLSKQSVLSHSMLVDGWSDAAFLNAVLATLDDPSTVPCRLFSIRAEMLVGEQSVAQARARLSGLLIGQELLATRQFWDGPAVTLIGAPALCGLYEQALGALGIETEVLNSEAMTLKGLTSAFRTQRESTHA
ncbi:2-dehydro-3-deoxygalactonokinase [Planktotalea arctica]|uniref:2-dehydro-3-deoxygalactonokinase n=1 Tax=Planktotalea arctica TaxID=1481893 RepID=UPI00321BEBCD